MAHRLREASLRVIEGHSLAIPVIIHGLPERIDVLGASWQRSREFELTILSAAALARAGRDDAAAWDTVVRIASGRSLGQVAAGPDLRRTDAPGTPGLRTLTVIAEAEGRAGLVSDLSAALGVALEPLPAQITLYASDAARATALDDAAGHGALAPPLSPAEQDEIRRVISWETVLFDDDGIPTWADPRLVALGSTDWVFTPAVMRALAYAGHVHRHQRRKATGIPYLAHLVSVAALVAEDGGGELEVIAALLHDAAEDHGGEPRLLDIDRRFGGEVASMVRALSDSLLPEGALKERWMPRKRGYLDHLRTESRPGVLRVSNADKLHNARAILADQRQVGEAIWRRFEGSPEQQLWYYGELSAIFCERRPDSPLARELAETVRQLEDETRATLSALS